MPRLFTAFPDDQPDAGIEWLVRGDDGEVAGYGYAGDDELLALIEGETQWTPNAPDDVVVFVPASEAVALSCTVPGRNPNQIRRAAPYAIEEYLTGDIEDMHVACGPIVRNAPVRCLVAPRARMADWLGRLEAVGIVPGFLTADALALPSEPNLVSVLFRDDGTALVRTAEQTASLDVPNLAAALAVLHGDSDGEEPAAGEREGASAVRLRQINGALGDAELALTGFAPERVETVEIGDTPLQALSATFDGANAIDLLQGDYAVKRRAGGHWAQWRSVAAGAGAWFALALVLFAAQGLWAARQADALRAEANDIYREVYDARRVPGNPATRMRLRLGQAPADAATFHRLAAIFAAALRQLGDAYQLLSLSYSERSGFGGEVVVADYDALEEMRQALTGQGFDLVVVSAEQHDSRVRANLRITAGG